MENLIEGLTEHPLGALVEKNDALIRRCGHDRIVSQIENARQRVLRRKHGRTGRRSLRRSL